MLLLLQQVVRIIRLVIMRRLNFMLLLYVLGPTKPRASNSAPMRRVSSSTLRMANDLKAKLKTGPTPLSTPAPAEVVTPTKAKKALKVSLGVEPVALTMSALMSDNSALSIGLIAL